MKTKFVITTVIGMVLLLSCEKEESIIDKSILMGYYFQFTNITEQENGHQVMNDTIIYSFVNTDSIIATRHKYLELSNGSTEFIETETYTRLYLIKGNYISFDFTDSFILNPDDYLLGFKWEVSSMTKDELKIYLHSDYAPTGSTVLKCIKK